MLLPLKNPNNFASFLFLQLDIEFFEHNQNMLSSEIIVVWTPSSDLGHCYIECMLKVMVSML